MRIIVTGGAGFVGSHIVEELVHRGEKVLVIDDLSSGKTSNLDSNLRMEKMAIGDPGLKPLMIAFKPDAVVHCAAQAAVPVSVERPEFDAQVNILDGLNVVRASIDSGISKFIYINTGGALYGEPDYLPCDEGHPVRPIAPYGLSKATLESYLEMLLPQDVSVTNLRLANVYGPRQDPHGEAGVVAIFAMRMLDGQRVTIFGDGEQTRDFVYVKDVAEAVVSGLKLSGRESINIGTGKPTTVNEIFSELAKFSRYKRKPQYAGERTGDVRHIYLDVSRAESLLGWLPNTSLTVGLELTVESFEN